MVLFNYTSKELTAKIVYYGPGLCGKTTNLQFIYDNLPTQVKKGKMLSLATKTDRTLFFDFLPIELGKIRGMKTRVQLYTVPGQVFYNSTRKLVLKGADGLVFVADSQQKMMESNGESYKNLEENLKEIGLRLDEMPLVMQFNKRDLPHLASVEEMNTLINRHNAPFYEAVATTGIGVEDTLKAITKLVLNHLAAKYNLGVAPEEGAPADAERAGGAPSLREGGKGAPVSAGPGALEIEPSPSSDRSEANFPQETQSVLGGNALDLAGGDEGGGQDLFRSDEEPANSQDSGFGESPAPATSLLGEESDTGEGAVDLEMVDLGDSDELGDLSIGESAPGSPSEAGAMEDLSELLEELPAEPGDEPRPTLDEPVPDFGPRKTPAPVERPSAAKASPGFFRKMSEAPPAPPRETTSANGAPTRPSLISPLDPLGIAGGRKPEGVPAKAIQVGSVTPGREHEITVPLEISVEGRRLRLNLKMTLMLSR